MLSEHILGKWKYILSKTQSRIFLVIILIILLVILISVLGVIWWDIVEPIITFLTLGIALLVGYQQMRQEWEEDYLPKKFSGSFWFEDKEIMRFENAMLTNEGDIRALAQQIGSQMVSLKTGVQQASLPQLKFAAPEVKVVGPTVHKKEKYIHYAILFKLTELPPGIDKDICTRWNFPFTDKTGKPTLS